MLLTFRVARFRKLLFLLASLDDGYFTIFHLEIPGNKFFDVIVIRGKRLDAMLTSESSNCSDDEGLADS